MAGFTDAREQPPPQILAHLRIGCAPRKVHLLRGSA
jgi:hypothetical protein